MKNYTWIQPGHRWGIALAVLSLVILALDSEVARADGCFVWNKQADINEPSQKAIILYDQGHEDLILQVRYEGPAEEFGWLIPVPAKPTVDKASLECFYELSQLTQTRGKQEASGVNVLESKTVGNYDIAVLATTNAGALSAWLSQHHFIWPENRRDVLEHYTRKKWFFVAVRINLEQADAGVREQLRKGELHPLKLSFDSSECVYPLKVSSVNQGFSDVDIYVLGAERLVSEAMDFFTWSSSSTQLFSDDSLRRCAADLPRLKAKSWHLVKHTRRFYPEMMEDLTLTPRDDRQWQEARGAFLRDYFIKRQTAFFAELSDYEKELGYKTLAGHWRTGAARTAMELERISDNLTSVADVAPDIQVDLAVALLGQEQLGLLRFLLARPFSRPPDAFAVRLAEKLLSLPPALAQSWREDADVRGPLLEMLGGLGSQGRAGIDVLATALTKVDSDIYTHFPLSALALASLVQTNPNPRLSVRMVEFLKHITNSADEEYAAQFFSAVHDEAAVEPLLTLCRKASSIRRDLLFSALWSSQGRRTAEPNIGLKETDPGALLRALQQLDPESAHLEARSWIESALNGMEGRAYVLEAAIDHLASPKYQPRTDQRKHAAAVLVRAASRAPRTQFDPIPGRLIVPIAAALDWNCRSGDPWLAGAISCVKTMIGTEPPGSNRTEKARVYLDHLQQALLPAPAAGLGTRDRL